MQRARLQLLTSLDAEATYSLAGRRVWLRPADLSGPGSLRRKALEKWFLELCLATSCCV